MSVRVVGEPVAAVVGAVCDDMSRKFQAEWWGVKGKG